MTAKTMFTDNLSIGDLLATDQDQNHSYGYLKFKDSNNSKQPALYSNTDFESSAHKTTID